MPGDDVGISSFTSDEQDFIGEIYSFGGITPVTQDSPGCANHGEQQALGVLSRAQISITAPILQLANDKNQPALSELVRMNVKPFLKRNLTWKFISSGGIEMSADQFPKTKVLVYAGLSKSNEVGTRIEHRIASSGAPSKKVEVKIYSTPSYGVKEADGEYAQLYDAGEVRRKQLRHQTEVEGGGDNPPRDWGLFSHGSEREYTKDDW